MNSTPDETETIAIVKSTAFDYGNAELDAKVGGPPGSDFANYVLQQLVSSGWRCLGEPVPGEEGWTFDVEIAAKPYRVFVHWAPIGFPPSDRWVIQPDILKTLIRSLFGRKTSDQEVHPIVRELRRVLESSALLDEIHWVSRNEFSAMY